MKLTPSTIKMRAVKITSEKTKSLRSDIRWFTIKRAAMAPLIVAIILLTNQLTPGQAADSWAAPVDSLVRQQLEEAGEAEFIIFFDQQADLSEADAIANKVDRREFVYQQLQKIAKQSQAETILILKAQATDFRPYWITNMIWVKGDADLLAALTRRQDIARIYANPYVRQELPRSHMVLDNLNEPASTPWNIDLVSAPDVWNLSFLGQGVVVGGQDTGYEWDHPALINQYRGSTLAGVDHNYNWHDAIHENSSQCPPDSPEPCDGYGHGTHTMGIMIGDDGQGNQIGMAPEAKWIGCRNMNDAGVGSPITYSECYQWFVAPTDLSGANPDPSKGPDVISNSWSCPPGEGCNDPEILLKVVQNVRAAGILTVHSAGNRGPTCGSVDYPAAIYDESFTVGATTSADVIWTGSSRGPVLVDSSNRLKPDISAPGISIYSSLLNDQYGFLSGTSMAAPHVAGLAALMISAQPQLAGNVDLLEELISLSAIPKYDVLSCGGIQGDAHPNNTYGYGRIDALAAVDLIMSTKPTYFLPVLYMTRDMN